MNNPKSEIKETQFAILPTKLYIPQPRSDRVQRTHLIDRLQEGISRKLTLISAPAGFGKSTLLSEWISQSDMQVVWISLDKSDNDSVQFTRYLIAGLKKIEPSIGEGAIQLLKCRASKFRSDPLYPMRVVTGVNQFMVPSVPSPI